MRSIKCDICGKEISLDNFGKKQFNYTHNGHRVIIKAGSVCDAYAKTEDICVDCVIDIMKKGNRVEDVGNGK